MDFWGTVVVLFRRWYIALPAFGMAVGAAFAIYASIPTTYQSTAVLVLTTPTTGGTTVANPKYPNGLTNPLLNFDKGLSISASIVIEALGNPATLAELGVTTDGDPQFQVNNGSSNLESLTQSPFVFITGESTSAERARGIVLRVMASARKVLTARQKALEAPIATYITLNEVVPPTTPQPQRGRKLRATAVAFALGSVASLCAVFAAESIAHHRSSRRLQRIPAEVPQTAAADDFQCMRH